MNTEILKKCKIGDKITIKYDNDFHNDVRTNVINFIGSPKEIDEHFDTEDIKNKFYQDFYNEDDVVIIFSDNFICSANEKDRIVGTDNKELLEEYPEYFIWYFILF